MRTLLPAIFIFAAAPLPAIADQSADLADIASARKFAEPAIGARCDFGKTFPVGNNVFHLAFRTKGQDQDSPDLRRTLVQLTCSVGAYNVSSIWLMRGDSTEGWELLSFAEPVADFDYADEDFSRLVAPPKVGGYATTTLMTNSDYDADSLTITSSAKWRGLGDAWSAGEWRFEQGVFVLKRYEIDPTFNPPGDAEPNNDVPESYVLFGNETGR